MASQDTNEDTGEAPSRRRSRRRRKDLPAIGWREWLALPDLDVDSIKAKIDTGARSSTLHAFDVEHIERDGAPWVRFVVHPVQRSSRETVVSEARLLDERYVRNSGGKEQLRPVILTTVELDGERWPIELTLTNRDAMGFRMLLGRQAVRNRFVVDAGRSFLTTAPSPRSPRPPRPPRQKGAS